MIWMRMHKTGVGLRVGSHYWHFRRDPLDLMSEQMRLNCKWWQVGRWRLTHRWGLTRQ